jgi:hypothetical protein
VPREFTPVSILSIIVPLRGAPAPFEDTLVSILQNRPARSEVFVVTAGDYDDPYDLGDEVTFVAAPPRAGLIELINAGVGAGDGEVVHVVQPGLAVEDGWTDAALAHFRRAEVGSVAPSVHSACGRAMRCGVGAGFCGRRIEIPSDSCQKAATPCRGPALTAGFWRKAAWEQAGGLDGRVGPHYADLDLALSLQTLGYSCVAEPRSRVVERVRQSVSTSPWSDGRSAEVTFWKHARRSGRRAYALHALGLTGEFLAAIPRPRRMIEFLGRVSALRSAVFSPASSSFPATATSPGELLRRREGAALPDRRPAPRGAVQSY